METIGTKLITQERLRQISDEGWHQKHDALHTGGELLQAAACYISAAQTALIRPDAVEYHSNPPFNQGPAHWPWLRKWWKPSNDPIRNLEKAGALIAAEIDRLKNG